MAHRYQPWDPEKWGPVAWRVLHSLAIISRPRDMDNVLYYLARAIPCDECSGHLSDYISTRRVPRDVPGYIFTLHNFVNLRTQKRVLARLPAYLPPSLAPSFCSDVRTLVRLMKSRRENEDIRSFVQAVDQAMQPFKCPSGPLRPSDS